MLLFGKKFIEVNILINCGAITYFNLAQPWILRITCELSSEKIVGGISPQGDNGELRVPISDC